MNEKEVDAWLIEGCFLMEAYLGGMVIAEISSEASDGRYLVNRVPYKVVKKFSQTEFDSMMREFYEQHGYYPDT